jgi:hypothetical protein
MVRDEHALKARALFATKNSKRACGNVQHKQSSDEWQIFTVDYDGLNRVLVLATRSLGERGETEKKRPANIRQRMNVNPDAVLV